MSGTAGGSAPGGGAGGSSANAERAGLPGAPKGSARGSFGSSHAASWETVEAGENYERSRSGYPSELVQRLITEGALGPASTVADVAAGTGKFTRLLVGAVRQVVAVEPAHGMRLQVTRAVPGVPVVAATAEALPFAGASLDGVTVAQAFHWFRHDDALGEFARVVRPGGCLALVWNIDDPVLDVGPGPPGTELSLQVREVCDRYERLRPRPLFKWRAALDRARGWEEVRTVRVHSSETVTIDTLVARVASRSFTLLLEADDRRALLGEVKATGAAAADSAGLVTLPTATVMYWIRRL